MSIESDYRLRMAGLKIDLDSVVDKAMAITESHIKWHLTQLQRIYYRHKFRWISGMGTHVLYVDPPIFGKCLYNGMIEPSAMASDQIYKKTVYSLAPLWEHVDACYAVANILDETFNAVCGELHPNKT